jgi:hypothetical protein
MVTKPKAPTFSQEQDVLLLRFLDGVKPWLADFSFDIKAEFSSLVENKLEYLEEQIATAEKALNEKPGEAVRKTLSAYIKEAKGVIARVRKLVLPDAYGRAVFSRYEIATVFSKSSSGSRKASAAQVRQADLTLEILVPDKLAFFAGGEVGIPDELTPLKSYYEDMPEMVEHWESDYARAMQDPRLWVADMPDAKAELTVVRVPQIWHLIIAPESEGPMASFQRLQQVRSWAGDLEPHFLGVVTDSVKLADMAEEQGYMSYLAALGVSAGRIR